MKQISNNVRSNEAFAMMHLFEFTMRNLDGTFKEVLYFTDHDIFVTSAGNEYIPLPISFDRLVEDVSMSSDSINLTIDNINGALTQEALASEWRNNNARIVRVIYTPPEQTFGAEDYEFGVIQEGEASVYPNVNFDTAGITFDSYVLFKGKIDTFSATSQALSASLTTQFSFWQKPFPPRTYSQNEFTSMVDTINDSVYWGRVRS